MTTLIVGDKIPDAEALDALPVGAAVTLKGSRKLLTRHPGASGAKGGWASHSQTQQLPSERMWWDGMELVSLPGIVYDGPMVGDVITTAEQLDALPEAAVIVRTQDGSNNYAAFKIGPNTPEWSGNGYDGQWYDYYFGRQTSEALITALAERRVEVESLPVELFETLDQFKWRFRDLAITGNERALGYPTHVLSILDTLGVGFNPSVGMRITNKYDREQLPDGTRLYVGSPEGDPTQFALWCRQDGTWVKVFGESETAPTDSIAVVIDALPVDGGVKTEPDEWLTKVASPEDAAEVRAMRRSGWVEGLKEKKARSWCDEFERVMLRGGMSAELTKIELPGGIKVGDVVTVEQARSLPVGSVFTVTLDEELSGVYQRTADAKNKAGTVRLFGRNGLEVKGNSRPHMTLINNVFNDGIDDRVILQIPSIEFHHALPLGSRISQGASAYQKVVDCYDGSVRCWAGAPRTIEVTDPALAQLRDGAFWARDECIYGVVRFGPA